MTCESATPEATTSIDEQAPVDPVIESHERYRRKAPLRRACGLVLGFITIAAVAIAVPAAFYLTYCIRDRQAYERELSLLREAGGLQTLEAVEASYRTDPATERTTQLWLTAIEPIDDDYHAHAKGVALVGEKKLQQAETDERGLLAGADLAVAKELVDRYRPTIDASHAARRSGPIARYPVAFEKLFDWDAAHVFRLRGLGDLLALDCEVRLAEGDTEAAVEDLLSVVAAGESLQNEPIFASQLIRAHLLGQAESRLHELLARVELSDDRLAELQQAFENVEAEAGFRRSLRVERFLALKFVRGDSPIGDPKVEKNASVLFRDADAAKTLEFYRLADESTRERLLGMSEAQRTIDEEVKLIDASSFETRRHPLLRILGSTDAFEGQANSALNTQARANLTATALACERYRLREGRWPATLDDLSPDFMTAVPLDPFVVRSLRYAVEADGIRLYSLAADRDDDGGVEDTTNYNEGDIVVRLPTERSGKDLP